MLKNAINRVVTGQDMSEEEAVALMDEIMSGKATDAQIAALITALRIKGETVAEITGFARVMRKMATPIKTGHSMLIDTCGTGGDGCNTFNISTTVAFVAAGAGIPVAKHGNRSVSSRSGSADVLEALGVNINLAPEQAGACIDKVGIGFLFAPALHGAMKYAIGPRREIGIRTVFNILGPLTNPAGAQVQILGVYDPLLTDVMAGVLANLGTKRAFVVHGTGGLDEISTIGPSRISEVQRGTVETYDLDPAGYGIKYASLEDLKGGTAEENAAITLEVLSGVTGPRRDIVLLNSAVALFAADTVPSIKEGIDQSAAIIDSGAAMRKLDELKELSNSFAGKNMTETKVG
ncbi:anthranilate phosphoribosyltransferase [Phosphitispora sp. TUW77]|uniref:anthranilate phosphoribosyltransferase n=1 Tax=Phosphitispora sp. TUW77 TaxID=3152361 RepID=UPI003AB3730F